MEARYALRRLRAWPVIAGRLHDWEQVVSLVVRFSEAVAGASASIASLEINPVMVTAMGEPFAIDVRMLGGVEDGIHAR